MPKDDINYKFTENGIVYDFYDVFVPAENFRQPTLFTFGNNGQGQLGTNDITDRGTPVTTFAGGTTWKQISCGGYSSAAIKTDGTLWTWGHNQSGQLGTNDTTSRSTPVTTFAGGNNWKSLSCGQSYTTAIKTDGTLWVWGVNFSGQLGTNDTSQRNIPVTTFAGGNTWKQICDGSGQRFHTAAIKTDGSLWTWGFNSSGQLGDNTTTQRNIPVTTFAGGTNWKSVSCGRDQTVAVKTDGTLWIWGGNSRSQLGTNDANTRTTPVTTFAGGNNWKQGFCGQDHTTAIKTDGTLWTWGYNLYGALGDNTTTHRSTPVTTFAGGNNWKQVSCGEVHTTAIKTDGTLWSWGFGGGGRLGNNITAFSVFAIPVTTFAGGNNWKQVTTGINQTAAIKYSPDP
jgi:alpha-tubulin suppressor-like RCC1 family protein